MWKEQKNISKDISYTVLTSTLKAKILPQVRKRVMMFDTVGVIREKCWQYKAIGRPCRPDIAIAPNGVLKSEDKFFLKFKN